MSHRISNALNSYFGLPAMKELNVSIRPSNNFVMIGNQPVSLRVTTTTGLLPVFWFVQNQILLKRSLVVSELRVTSFRVALFYRSVGNLTPSLVQNCIVNSMDLLMRISFRVIVDLKRLRCNRISVSEFDHYTSTFLNKGWFVYLIDLLLHQM
jgi:hypothetical protein